MTITMSEQFETVEEAAALQAVVRLLLKGANLEKQRLETERLIQARQAHLEERRQYLAGIEGEIARTVDLIRQAPKMRLGRSAVPEEVS